MSGDLAEDLVDQSGNPEPLGAFSDDFSDDFDN